MSRDQVARGAATIAGVWLIAAPAVGGYAGVAATNDRIVGPIAAAFAFVAMWPVLTELRWPTIPCGAWLMLAPAALTYADAFAWISSITAGLAIAVTGLIGSDTRAQFGGGWRTIRPREWRSRPAE